MKRMNSVCCHKDGRDHHVQGVHPLDSKNEVIYSAAGCSGDRAGLRLKGLTSGLGSAWLAERCNMRHYNCLGVGFLI